MILKGFPASTLFFTASVFFPIYSSQNLVGILFSFIPVYSTVGFLFLLQALLWCFVAMR